MLSKQKVVDLDMILYSSQHWMECILEIHFHWGFVRGWVVEVNSADMDSCLNTPSDSKVQLIGCQQLWDDLGVILSGSGVFRNAGEMWDGANSM